MFRILGLALAVGSLLACAPPVVELEKVDGLHRGVLIGTSTVVPFDLEKSAPKGARALTGANITALYYDCDLECLTPDGASGFCVKAPVDDDGTFGVPEPDLALRAGPSGWETAEAPLPAHVKAQVHEYVQVAFHPIGTATTAPIVLLDGDLVLWTDPEDRAVLKRWNWRNRMDLNDVHLGDAPLAGTMDANGAAWFVFRDRVVALQEDEVKEPLMLSPAVTTTRAVELAVGGETILLLQADGVYRRERDPISMAYQFVKRHALTGIEPNRLLIVQDRAAFSGLRWAAEDVSVILAIRTGGLVATSSLAIGAVAAEDVAILPEASDADGLTGVVYMVDGRAKVATDAGSRGSTPASKKVVGICGETAVTSSDLWFERAAERWIPSEGVAVACSHYQIECSPGIVAVICETDATYEAHIFRKQPMRRCPEARPDITCQF